MKGWETLCHQVHVPGRFWFHLIGLRAGSCDHCQQRDYCCKLVEPFVWCLPVTIGLCLLHPIEAQLLHCLPSGSAFQLLEVPTDAKMGGKKVTYECLVLSSMQEILGAYCHPLSPLPLMDAYTCHPTCKSVRGDTPEEHWVGLDSCCGPSSHSLYQMFGSPALVPGPSASS